MSVTDYLLMRTPRPKLGASRLNVRAAPGNVSGSRIAISFVGIILGIVLSFYVTGLRSSTQSHSRSADESQQTKTNQTAAPESIARPGVTTNFSWNGLLKVGLISLVICGISYQGLYASLRLYENEPAFLILFVAFQYGYFWQSLVKGAVTVVAG